MIKELLEKIKNMAGDRASFDPSSLGDPVAMKTGWCPIKGGGSSFCTHKLAFVSADRLEFKTSVGAMIFYLLFLLVGLGVLIGFSYAILSNRSRFEIGMLIPLLVGLVFSGVGGGLFYFGTAPIVFDKRNGCFWKGRKSPREVANTAEIKYSANLDNIHALQLISEYCRGNKSSFYSYELNLVLKDGERVNVVDHGSQNKLREDSSELSKFLGKPVWDAI